MQSRDAVTGAQDMVNCPFLIFTEPFGRPITGMQWREGIASCVHRLNQIQFGCQNLRRGQPVFSFNQVRRTLHRRFQRRQIHFTRMLRQRRAQQFMLRHDGLALEDMGDGIIQGLVFRLKPANEPDGLNRRREFLQRLQFIGL